MAANDMAGVQDRIKRYTDLESDPTEVTRLVSQLMRLEATQIVITDDRGGTGAWRIDWTYTDEPLAYLP